MLTPRVKNILKWVLPIIFFLLLAFDGQTHWDETNFLYKASFAPYAPGELWLNTAFYYVRLMHLCLLRILFLTFGKGLFGLIAVESVMAMIMVGAALLFRGTLRLIFSDRGFFYPVFLAFLFLPLSIYLGFKSLGETTAIFFCSLSLYLYAVSLKEKGGRALITVIASSLCLFGASYAREAILLGFASFTLPVAFMNRDTVMDALKKLIYIGGIWLYLYFLVFFLFGIRCTDYVFQGLSPSQVAGDIADYPPNIVGIAFFGGAFWLFALVALKRWRAKATIVALIAVLVPLGAISIRANHIEMRYLSPAIFGFALLTGIGLNQNFTSAKKIPDVCRFPHSERTPADGKVEKKR